MDLAAEWRKAIAKAESTEVEPPACTEAALRPIRVHLWGGRRLHFDFELDVDGSTGRTSAVAALLWRERALAGSWVERRGRCPSAASEDLELEALLFGLRQAAAYLPAGSSVRAWTDSQGLVRHLSSGAIRRRAVSACEGLESVRVEWVPRWCVAEADLLARAWRHGRTVATVIPAVGVADRRNAQAARIARGAA